MYQLNSGINFSSHEPGKEWKFYHNYKCSRFGFTNEAEARILTDLELDGIEPTMARIHMTKTGSFQWADVYIKN